MENVTTSEGKCLFCGETFGKTFINRHLQSHLKQLAKESTTGQSYLVKIEPNTKWTESQPYFLSLWVDSSATMKNIDSFLRDIWLECCGHLSAFRARKNRRHTDMLEFFKTKALLVQGKQKEYEKIMAETNGEISMGRKTDKVFSKGLKLEYEYDFGTSTELVLTVIEEYPVKADKKIVLLSRNEPLQLLCDTCKSEPATQLCSVHYWEDECLFCDKCAKKHEKKCDDFKDYASMPVVNSPRMGMCGYEGGIIDVERDGVFVKKQ
jgi:hypothetical protein